MINNIFFKILLVFLIGIAAIYCAYQYYQNSKPVITIYPDELPTKIKPLDIENIALPAVHSTIYENLISKDITVKTATILPEPEKPIIINSRNQSEDPFDIDSLDEISSLISLIEPNVSEVSHQQIEHEKNKTGLNIIKLTKENENNSKIKNFDNTGNYKIQLGSVKSEAEALREGERIKKKFPKILKNAVITTQKVKYEDGKFFYLILAGDYDSLSQAKAVCKKLAHNKQNCVLK